MKKQEIFELPRCGRNLKNRSAEEAKQDEHGNFCQSNDEEEKIIRKPNPHPPNKYIKQGT